MHRVLSSLSSCIRIIAYHLGTLDLRHMEPNGNVEAEPEDGARMDQFRRWKDRLESCLGQRCYQAGATEDPAQGLVSTNTDLVLPQASPGA